MAKGEVVAGEAMLLRAKDQGDAPARLEFVTDDGSQCRQLDDCLLGLARPECAGAEDEGCGGECLGECAPHFCVLEELFGTYSRLCFAPVGLIRGDDSEVAEAEVGHGARHCADVEGVARGDEDDVEAVELVFAGQENIVVCKEETLAWRAGWLDGDQGGRGRDQRKVDDLARTAGHPLSRI